MRWFGLSLFFGAACIFAGGVARGASVELAIGGYDPVAYFTEGKARRGEARFDVMWDGSVYRFASEENRQRFMSAPERYAPRYGGWCAYAVSQGYLAEVDPVDGWTVRDGRLYMNWDSYVKKQWLSRVEGYIARADESWPRLKEALGSSSPPKISRK